MGCKNSSFKIDLPFAFYFSPAVAEGAVLQQSFLIGIPCAACTAVTIPAVPCILHCLSHLDKQGGGVYLIALEVLGQAELVP